jgi:hypothetical protein
MKSISLDKTEEKTEKEEKKQCRYAWSVNEDSFLKDIVLANGIRNWNEIAKKLEEGLKGVKKTGKQCRERWKNYLDPNLTTAQWTDNEECLLTLLHFFYENKWSTISKYIKERSHVSLKNYFYSLVRSVITKISKTIVSHKQKSSSLKFFQSLYIIHLLISKYYTTTPNKQVVLNKYKNERIIMKLLEERDLKISQINEYRELLKKEFEEFQRKEGNSLPAEIHKTIHQPLILNLLDSGMCLPELKPEKLKEFLEDNKLIQVYLKIKEPDNGAHRAESHAHQNQNEEEKNELPSLPPTSSTHYHPIPTHGTEGMGRTCASTPYLYQPFLMYAPIQPPPLTPVFPHSVHSVPPFNPYYHYYPYTHNPALFSPFHLNPQHTQLLVENLSPEHIRPSFPIQHAYSSPALNVGGSARSAGSSPASEEQRSQAEMLMGRGMLNSNSQRGEEGKESACSSNQNTLSSARTSQTQYSDNSANSSTPNSNVNHRSDRDINTSTINHSSLSNSQYPSINPFFLNHSAVHSVALYSFFNPPHQ